MSRLSTTLWKLAAAGAASYWTVQGLRWLSGMRRLPVLHPSPQATDKLNYTTSGPSQISYFYDVPLAIIVPACDEEETVGRGVGSLLAHAPEHALVVAVDDRSTDRTGEVLDRLAATEDRLHVVHIDRLPPGWLGKTHAIQEGTEAARHLLAENGLSADRAWFLFTDADVVFENGGIEAAMGYAVRNDLDMLALFPRLDVRGFWETVFTSAFMFLFALNFRAWAVNDPRSDAYIGVGAFNMVRADAYERMGGHRKLRLDVTDDVGLGREMRRSGARTGMAMGMDILTVRWQHSLSGLVTGLEKNAFAGVDYSVPRLLGSTAGLLLITSPFAGIWLTRGWARRLNALALLMLGLIHRQSRRYGGPPWPYAFTYPLGTALFLLTLWRSAILALRRGGIIWRGTFYSLAELKGGRV